MEISKETVVVGMSGGVDSSVAAYLLKKQGYNVIGLFMQNWNETDENGCCTAEADFADVEKVCDQMGIPYFSVNFAKEYKERVFAYFLDEYKKGRTPNPDVLCNREIKFGPFLEMAQKLGATKIATGHYAKTEKLKDGTVQLLKSKDKNKDQSYFLSGLSQAQLSWVLFPLSDLDKTEVRKIAAELNLSTAAKKDSTGVCFIGERDFKKFLQGFLPAQPGNIVTPQGEVVGRHDGLMYYTIGQRRGLGIGGMRGFKTESWFVADKSLASNELVVAQGSDTVLLKNGLIAKEINWICGMPKQSTFVCKAKFRYRQPDQNVSVCIKDDLTAMVQFDTPQRGITPGQFVVFYEGDICIGGGMIDQAF